jgi:hypothetical protein
MVAIRDGISMERNALNTGPQLHHVLDDPDPLRQRLMGRLPLEHRA